MSKKAATILREYAEKYFIPMGATVVSDGNMAGNCGSDSHYHICYSRHDGFIMLSTDSDDVLTVGIIADDRKDCEPFFTHHKGHIFVKTTLERIYSYLSDSEYCGATIVQIKETFSKALSDDQKLSQ